MDVYVFILLDRQFDEPMVNSHLKYFARYEHALKYASKSMEDYGYELSVSEPENWEEDERGVYRSYYTAGPNLIQIDRLSPSNGEY